METRALPLPFVKSQANRPYLRYQVSLGNCWLEECELFHPQHLWFDKHQTKLKQSLGEIHLNQDKQLGSQNPPALSVISVLRLHV